MPRRVYLLGVGLALVALALAVTDWALSLRPGVTEANVRRIQTGMTRQQAEPFLGRPPDHTYRLWARGIPWEPAVGCLWVGDAVSVQVGIRADRVVRVDWEHGGQSRDLLDRLRAWLGW
jgi:hypothetical protein